jgi:hypothetical protein
MLWRIKNALDFFQVLSVVMEDGLECIQVSLETVLVAMTVTVSKVDSTEISFAEW